MKRILTTAAALVMLAGPAFAQSTTAPAANNDETILNNNSDMVNDDAALPGGAEAGTSTGTSTETTESIDGSTAAPMDDAGASSQQAIVPADPQADVDESTPSSGVVPGQEPE